MLFIWLIYYFLFTSNIMSSFNKYNSTIEHNLCYWLEFFIILLSVVFGAYHNKVKR